MPQEFGLMEAIVFAAEKHAGQVRKDGTAYIYHPIHVAGMLKDSGYGEDYQIAAVLHDVLEDADATEEDVSHYGEAVLKTVKLVTRPDGMDEEEYVSRILTNPMAAAVKNADKIHNLHEAVLFGSDKREMSEKELQFARRYVEKSARYYKGRFTKELDECIIACDAAIHDMQ